LLGVSAVTRQLAVLLIGVAGCIGGDHDMEISFHVVDHLGKPVPDAAARCSLGCSDLESSCVRGDVEPLGGGDYRCTVTDNGENDLELAAAVGTAFGALELVGKPQTVPEVMVWAPSLTFEELDDRLQVSWDPPPPRPASATARVVLSTLGDDFVVDSPASEMSWSRAFFEDFDAELGVVAEEETGSASWYQNTPRVPVPHTPLVPVSRGAACGAYDATAGVFDYPAGTCPLTDGSRAAIACGTPPRPCAFASGIVDLGAETVIDRIFVRGEEWGGTFPDGVEVSTDGVTFTEMATTDPLPQPTSMRYIRFADLGVTEISAFAPLSEGP